MTPIRKGANPVKIPFAIKSSDRTFAAWANETRTAIQQLEARMPTANVGRSAGAGSKPPLWASISRVPDSDPASYQATVTTGYLCYQNATLSESDDGVVGYLVPRIMNADGELVSIESDGTPEWVAPKLPLDGVVNYIYLRVKTDADGAPKAPKEPEFPGDPSAEDGPTIEAFAEPQQSIHHVRPSPSGGEEEGDYFFLICETESNGATPTPAPRVVRRITGNRELPNQLIEITNIGGKRELYQGYLVGPDDKHELRTIEQIESRGEPIIKPLDDGDPDATPPVPAEEEGPTIKWKTVAERATSPQIRVSTKENGDAIVVEGNGEGGGTGGFAALVTYDDGLWTSVLDVPFGLDTTIRVPDECGTLVQILTFEKGLLVDVAFEAVIT